MWWWIIGVAVAAVVVLLAPFIRQSPDTPSKDEEALSWIDEGIRWIGGLWPHR